MVLKSLHSLYNANCWSLRQTALALRQLRELTLNSLGGVTEGTTSAEVSAPNADDPVFLSTLVVVVF